VVSTTTAGRRLNAKTLTALAPAIARPRSADLVTGAGLETGIVHIGLGAFHRAHQAVYTDDSLNRTPGPWGICGVSLRSPDTRDALAPQDCLYTVAVRDASGDRLRVVGSITETLVAPEDPSTVLDRLTRPATRIVTITVTEKGYCHEPATGALNRQHPGIQHDLQNPAQPQTLPGFLVEALDRRRQAGIPPFTVLSCDNLPNNGHVTAGILRQFADLRDPALGRWIASNVACPGSMVDRIVPATTDEDREAISRQLGLTDAWPVMTEPFSQWVIEDHFPTGRPAWELEGAELVADVRPYELMKLRLLNGSHSCIAYLGYLAGHATVSDAMADAIFVNFIRALMDEEVTPTLDVPPGADLTRYKAALLERFANPALKHRTWQIAMDGSQKLPQRLLGTIRDRLAAGASFDRLALGVAAWMRYVGGVDEQGQPIDVRDPLADRLKSLPDAAALLGVREVFGNDLANNPTFVATVTDALDRLRAKGARGAIQSLTPNP
jgi:fructuronate reductase